MTNSIVRNTLLKILDKVDRPGTIYCAGDLPITMPGLDIQGIGAVGLPLGNAQARKLIKLCRQAPYGKGAATLVDTNVRRAWELDPERFRLTNPKWDEFVTSIIADVQQEMGLGNRKLSAHLYKLLVYERGCFFLPHRDGEKLDRMVATLVICLPSIHEGGELIVSHGGQQHQIFFSGAATGHELSYAAFYADCQHEIRALTSGFRICLTYNVTLAKSRGKKGISAPSYGATITSVTKQLRDWQGGPDMPKMAVILDHRYTQAGLSMDTLKGIDHARAEVLFAAAEQAECIAHLALVTLWQNGAAEGDYDYDYSYGRSRYHSWSDDEDEENNTGTEYEMGEIFDCSLTADHWSDRRGNKVNFGEIHLDEDEIVVQTSLDDWEPDEEDFEGFTGNAGMTLERWYHRAAIIIWPLQQHFTVLCGAGTDAAVGGLESMVKGLRKVSKARRDQSRQHCLSFAAEIIETWQQRSNMGSWENKGESSRQVFPALLSQLDSPELMRRFLSQVMIEDGEVQLGITFTKLCHRHGWGNFASELTAIIETTTADTIIRNSKLLQLLCTGRDKDIDRVALCIGLCDRAVKALVAFDSQLPKTDPHWRAKEIDRSALLSFLVKALLAVGAEKPLSQLISHSLAYPNKYDLTDAHVTAIFKLKSELARLSVDNLAISHWLGECRLRLQDRTARAPQKPTDYRRSGKLSCNCDDCGVLSRFLVNPDQPQGRFPLAKNRRQHLHQIIDSDGCDLTHITERRGRPFTLVCTKTTASYNAACKIHERDLANLSRIFALEKQIQ